MGKELKTRVAKVRRLVVVRNLSPSAMEREKNVRLKRIEYKNLKNLKVKQEKTTTTR